MSWELIGVPAVLAGAFVLVGLGALVFGRRGLARRNDRRGVVGLGVFVGSCTLLAGFFAFNALFYWVTG